MEIRLDGKTALVTGAGRNLGRSIALSLAEAGAAVVVNARTNREEAEAVVREIEASGGQAVAHLADVGDVEAVALAHAAQPCAVPGVGNSTEALDILVQFDQPLAVRQDSFVFEQNERQYQLDEHAFAVSGRFEPVQIGGHLIDDDARDGLVALAHRIQPVVDPPEKIDQGAGGFHGLDQPWRRFARLFRGPGRPPLREPCRPPGASRALAKPNPIREPSERLAQCRSIKQHDAQRDG